MIFEFFGPLRTQVGMKSISIKIEESVNLKEALRMLPQPVRDLIIDDNGAVRPGIMILVNDVDARTVYGFDVMVSDNDRVTLIPMIHGGYE